MRNTDHHCGSLNSSRCALRCRAVRKLDACFGRSATPPRSLAKSQPLTREPQITSQLQTIFHHHTFIEPKLCYPISPSQKTGYLVGSVNSHAEPSRCRGKVRGAAQRYPSLSLANLKIIAYVDSRYASVLMMEPRMVYWIELMET